MREQRTVDNNKECQAETFLPPVLLATSAFPKDFLSRDTNVTWPILELQTAPGEQYTSQAVKRHPNGWEVVHFMDSP